MAFLTVNNVAITGIVSCTPPFIEENSQLPFYKNGEAAEVIKKTGIERRHIVKEGITASDLCFQAGLELLRLLEWEKDSIDAICYVTQTPDFINHPTGFVLHEKLGLSDNCMVLDLFHGCPGWVIGLSTIASQMQSGALKRVILFVGDSTTPWGYANDRESRPLFGDCGTATALEYDESASPMFFHIGTKSSDGWALVRKEGAARFPYNRETFEKEMQLREGSLNLEGNADTMDGMSVFSFGITVPPKSMKRLCEYVGIDIQSIDRFVIHQANLFIIEKIVKKLKIDWKSVPISLKEYGNVTSASIPLTICSQCHEEYSSGRVKSLVCGFGTGLSWGTAYFETDRIACVNVITYNPN